MAKFKDFGAGSDTPQEPISFAIHGETFECKPAIQGKFLLDLVARSANQDDPSESAKVIGDFFKTVLSTESYSRFTYLSEDSDKIVDVETLSEIVGWLVEQYTDRPTQRPELS
jgi:hypothetical protein